MKKTLSIIIVFIFLPIFAHASTASIKVDTHNVSINTIEGTVVIPRNISISKINDGNSVILFWIKPASLDVQTNTVYFAGLTPGGFAGVQTIFSIIGDFKLDDLKDVIFKDVSAFKNDGKGTPTKVKMSAVVGTDTVDSISPEVFKPIISKSEEIFDNNRFISFATQDKGVGIDHYEYKTTFAFFGEPDKENWQIVDSPVELSITSLFQKIFIKAVDRSGNERLQSTVGPYFYYLWSLIWVIILSLVICVLSYMRRFLR